MADDLTTDAIIYSGEFEHGVDASRRVMIPARWLPANADPKKHPVEYSLIVWSKSANGKCLRVLTRAKMMELIEQINAQPNTDPLKGERKRTIGRDSTQVVVDKQGRICLPEGMVEAAGIQEKAVMVGLLDRFEIWSPERNKAERGSEAVRAPEVFNMME